MISSRQSPQPMNSLSPYNMQYSPSPTPSPHHHRSPSSELEKYFTELVIERHNLSPFLQVLPNCGRLLTQEIVRVSKLSGPYVDLDILEHGSPLSSGSVMSNGRGLDSSGWSSAFQSELIQQTSSIGWRSLPGGGGISVNSPSHVVKKVLRIEVPVDTYPNFNFVGRLLGPRGNSLKRLESNTGCRIFIRGRGSIRDAVKEENLRDKPGYEHLSEPLHVLIEAEQPANMIDAQLSYAREMIEDLLKPVDETHDFFKKQQLRELAMLNGTLREDWNGSVSPFSNSKIVRLSKLSGPYVDLDILEHGSPHSSGSIMSNGRGLDSSGWSSAFQSELIQQASSIGWHSLPGGGGISVNSPSHVKKVLRIEVPVDTYPNFNFGGRLLGPRGNSLKHLESKSGCRIFISGRDSIRDAIKEENLREKPGYAHLSEPLHVLIEAEQPANMIDAQSSYALEMIEDLLKPVHETYDFFKKQQLRELAMLNGTLREDWNGSVSPFSNFSMKRAKLRNSLGSQHYLLS